MPKKPDVLTIEHELALRVEQLKKDNAAFPILLFRLSQYRKNKGLKRKWCPDCYINKKTETLGQPMPMGPSGNSAPRTHAANAGLLTKPPLMKRTLAALALVALPDRPGRRRIYRVPTARTLCGGRWKITS